MIFAWFFHTENIYGKSCNMEEIMEQTWWLRILEYPFVGGKWVGLRDILNSTYISDWLGCIFFFSFLNSNICKVQNCCIFKVSNIRINIYYFNSSWVRFSWPEFFNLPTRDPITQPKKTKIFNATQPTV